MQISIHDGGTGVWPFLRRILTAIAAVPISTADSSVGFMRSPLSDASSTFGLLASGTAYWIYLGRRITPGTMNFVSANVTVGGVGSQTAEMCVATSPNAPDGGSVVLTKLAATGSVDALTGTGLKRSASMNALVPAGTHVWAGIRTAMALTQPSFSGLGGDHGHGAVLTTAAAGALTGAGPWTGSVVAGGLLVSSPRLDLAAT